MKISSARTVGVLTFALAAIVATFVALSPASYQASAGPQISGDPNGATSRYLIQDGQTVKRIVYVAAGAKTMANTTPVAGDPQCGLFGAQHRADVIWSATMTGTAPTLTVVWQNSIDGGVTWADVTTYTAYNATSNPATQTSKVSDIPNGVVYASTAAATLVPQMYGDCWRTVYTFGGTGTVTASFNVVGIEK